MIFNKPITIEKQDEMTEKWAPVWNLHAYINKTQGSEQTASGAGRSKTTKTFEIRYFSAAADIEFSRQIYRIVYRGQKYNIVDYDDYMEQHRTIKLTAEVY